MKITFTSSFKKTANKLPRNQKKILEDLIETIQQNPTIGDLKKGDLAGVRVHKFHMQAQLMLLAYFYVEDKEMTLLSLSSHENFYRDLKRNR